MDHSSFQKQPSYQYIYICIHIRRVGDGSNFMIHVSCIGELLKVLTKGDVIREALNWKVKRFVQGG